MWLEAEKARNFNAVVWVLGEVNGYDPQADAVHAGPGSRPGVGPPPDLVALRRSQGLLPGPDADHKISPAPALRAHLHAPHRLRHARPVAEAAARQQGRVASRAGAARNPAAHQRLGE